MNKKLVASLVATMAVGATAFAANPFVDVPSDSWAYNSVVELANSGIIQGVDGVHFQGERNITRYEAAEIVAKAMAHEDRANAEQRALINRLADEFSDELNNLGVRVSNLEDRVGNVKLTGDARVRYMKQGKALENDKSWQFRGRLRANAKINDRADAVLGMEYNTKFANDTTASASSAGKDHFYVDRAYVNYALDNGHKWNAMVGRYDYELGNNMGLIYGNNFDGAQLKFANGKFAATAGYGKFKEGAEASGPVVANSAATPPVTAKDVEIGLLNGKTAYGELEGFFGGGTATGSAVGVYYNDFNASSGGSAEDAKVWGAYASLNFAKKFNLNAEAYRVNYDKASVADADGFSAKLTYGKAKFDTPKSWDLWVNYINIEDGAADDSGTGSWRTNVNNTKGWAAGADYTFAKNAQLQVFQTFDTKIEKTGKDRDELTRAQFVFVF